MEAEVFNAEFLHKFKSRVNFCLCVFHCTFNCAERFIGGVAAEHIGAGGAEVVPPCHGERKVLFHLFAEDDSFGVVKFKSKGIF